tara:strand:+ start:41022 stop:41951 length:930 start_codon:yes stop_codon:yes gene_type:complete
MHKKTVTPTVHISQKGFDAFHASHAHKAQELLSAWADFFGKNRLKMDDIISKMMLYNKKFAYKKELEATVKASNLAGVYSLNFNRYLGCTSAIKDSILYRTLDVTAPALGETLHLVEKETPHGAYTNLTWPGFVGVATAVAPNRFALAYNEAPQPNRWPLINIFNIIVSRNIPPLWLSRQVMENCKNYDEAKKILTHTPLCTSAIYTLMGGEGEGCMIERTPTKSVVHTLNNAGYTVAGNHWQNDKFAGLVISSKKTSYERCIFMEKFLRQEKPTNAKPFDWLEHPIANDTTRFACELSLSQPAKIRIL